MGQGTQKERKIFALTVRFLSVAAVVEKSWHCRQGLTMPLRVMP
jgi:hypothetical protein